MTGNAGAAGIAGATGLGGAGASSAAGGKGGGAGAGGSTGVGGSVQACGDVGSACCGGSTCNDGLTCLLGATCSCAQALFGRYILRTDGNLLYEDDASAQTPILKASTGLPLSGITSVVEGAYHGCALLTDQTVWCWRVSAGGNSAGQLGSGTTENSGPIFRATQVLTGANQSLTGVVALSSLQAGSMNDNTCAIAGADKNIYCWGNTSYLILNGGATPYAAQITLDGVTPLAGAVQVATNGPVACSIIQGAASNEVWCWGANNTADLGTGDRTARQYPTKVVGISTPIKVVPFGANVATCAIDGPNVRCWGDNNNGEVGNGTTNSPILAPTLVTLMGGMTGLKGIVDLQGGYGESYSGYICALATDHTVKCWGHGFASYPQNYTVANVVALGNLDGDTVRLLTSDGLYHIGSATRAPNCSLLQ